ncbi:hypothetical protein LJC23_07350 [Desulfovibrio sp. OttesenSCG-928-I05]|nr:hypothetical protein [Desulfovibrio sp. OttesenSCG-928-I05]
MGYIKCALRMVDIQFVKIHVHTVKQGNNQKYNGQRNAHPYRNERFTGHFRFQTDTGAQILAEYGDLAASRDIIEKLCDPDGIIAEDGGIELKAPGSRFRTQADHIEDSQPGEEPGKKRPRSPRGDEQNYTGQQAKYIERNDDVSGSRHVVSPGEADKNASLFCYGSTEKNTAQRRSHAEKYRFFSDLPWTSGPSERALFSRLTGTQRNPKDRKTPKRDDSAQALFILKKDMADPLYGNSPQPLAGTTIVSAITVLCHRNACSHDSHGDSERVAYAAP